MEAKLLDILIAVRSDKIELPEAHNEIMKLLDINNRMKDLSFIGNVCLSYRHDFGLLPEKERDSIIFECKEWLHAIVNNLPYQNKTLKQPEPVVPVKRTIWTMGYFPFTLGGKVNAPAITEVEMIEEKEVGKGFKAFSFQTPVGIRIAESVTGAIVGNDFETVMRDIDKGSMDVMVKQVEDAKKILSEGNSKHFSNDEFFKLYTRSK